VLRWWDGTMWSAHVARPSADLVNMPHPTLPFRDAWIGLVLLVVPLLSGRWVLGSLADLDVPLAVYLVVGVLVSYGPAMAWCLVVGRRPGGDGLGLAPRWSDAGWGPLTWLACVGAQIAVGVIVLLTDVPISSNTGGIAEQRDRTALIVSIVVLVVVVAPLAEEILFRGLILRGLLERWRPALAVVVQGVVFGAVHVQPAFGLGNIGLVLVLSSVGVVLGGAAYLLRRIVPSIIAHAIINGIAVTVALSGWVADSPLTDN
jgi:uncharacterized protein